MSDDLPSDTPDVRPYEPFPSFADFAAIPFEPRLVATFAGMLQETRSSVSEKALRRSVERATKWAAVDTGAIEGLYEVDRGFTFSVALEAAAWAEIGQLKGERVARAIQDAMEAYEFVLDLATGSAEITEVWVKQLHEVVCASQETYSVLTSAGPQEQALPKGSYKVHTNNPLNLSSNVVYSYAPPDDTPAEMHRLVEELRSDNFQEAHAVVQAAYAHYAFVCIHPFADGNGRVARALASVYLYQHPGLPLVVFADQKYVYIDALEAADGGDVVPFVNFIAERVIDSIQMVRTDLTRPVGPTLDEKLHRLRTSLVGRGGLPHDEVDALAARLHEHVMSAFREHVSKLELEHPLSGAVEHGGPTQPSPDGYRPAPQASGSIQVQLNSAAPATGNSASFYAVAVARPETEPYDFILFRAGGEILQGFFIRELSPIVTAPVLYRLLTIAESEMDGLLDQVVAAGEATLRKSGYLR